MERPWSRAASAVFFATGAGVARESREAPGRGPAGLAVSGLLRRCGFRQTLSPNKASRRYYSRQCFVGDRRDKEANSGTGHQLDKAAMQLGRCAGGVSRAGSGRSTCQVSPLTGRVPGVCSEVLRGRQQVLARDDEGPVTLCSGSRMALHANRTPTPSLSLSSCCCFRFGNRIQYLLV